MSDLSSATDATTSPQVRPGASPWAYVAVGLLVVAVGVVTLVVGGTPTWSGEALAGEDYAALMAGVDTARVVGWILLAAGGVLATIGAVGEGVRIGTSRARRS